MTENAGEISLIKKEKRYLKTLYFVMFLAFGSISPFAAIFYKRILTNPDGSPAIHLIGIIVASVPVVGFFANLIVGVFADKFGISRRLITILSFFGAVIALIVGLCGTQSVITLALEQKFILLFFAVLAYNFVTISLNPLVDSETLQFLNKHSDRKKFGSFRIWGTYGWAVAALFMGIILTLIAKYFEQSNGTNYRFIYYSGAIAMLCLGILGKKAHVEISKKPKISYKYIFKDSLFIRFLIFVFLEGIVMTSTDSYLGYFFDDVMKSPLQIGMVYCFWTTFEIPVLAYSDKLLKKFGSRKILIAGIFFIVLELFLFSLFELDTPFILKFLATLMHGLAFSLHYIGLMDYLDRYAHKDMRTTYLATMNIARTTLATVAGGAIGAVIIAHFNSSALMRSGAVCMMFLAVFFLVFVKSPNER
ncbi:MAG: MFS transporter [Chitinispirillales bacterium]|jgi:PPP family 3-phenylpropionic acid transporter|nr:MFS transporter [Chitinispirillales bacterium]